MGAPAQAAPGSVQTARPAEGGGLRRRPPQHGGPAGAPPPRTHAGFMAAGSALPRRARGTPGRMRSAGWQGERVTKTSRGSRDTAAETHGSVKPGGTAASPGELAPGAFQTGQSAHALGKGRGLRGSDCSAGSGPRLLGDRRGKGARTLGASAPGLESGPQHELQPFTFPMRKLKVNFPTAQEA